MNRLIVAIGLGLIVAAGACNKPSEADCKKAINNIRKIKNFDPPSDSEMAAAVRTCRGNATKGSVECFMNATNAAELRECEGDIYEKMGGEAKPDEVKPDEVKPDEAATDEAATDEATTDEATTDEATPEGGEPEEATTDEATTDEATPEGAAADEAKPDEAATGDNDKKESGE